MSKNLVLENNPATKLAASFYTAAYAYDVINDNPLIDSRHFFTVDFEIFMDSLSGHLMGVIYHSCSCEFRHCVAEIRMPTKDIVTKLNDYIGEEKFTSPYDLTSRKGTYDFPSHRQHSVDQIKDTFKNRDEAIEIFQYAFAEFPWSKHYGGPKWAQGVEGLKMLRDAKDLRDKIIAIDHAYDLQHNNGFLMDKHSVYQGNKRFKRYLNIKRRAVNPRELFMYSYNSSSSFKYLVNTKIVKKARKFL